MTGSLKYKERAVRRSFSLLEMLLVLAVMAVVVGLVLEGYSATVQATAVTTGADMISDMLTE
jgi:prepilin-type N-terminal cleavage/methylation domain-containing protein